LPTATASATPSPTATSTPSPAASPPAGTNLHLPLTLQITQVVGLVLTSRPLLGAWHLQIVDSGGHVVSGIRLLTPITLRLHSQPGELALVDLEHARFYLSWPDRIRAAQQAHRSTSGLLAPLTANTATNTLSAQISTLDAGTLAASGSPTSQSAPAPLLTSEQGNSGQAGLRYPLAVAPGVGGVVPQLALVYSSGDTNGRHDPSASANDVGEGWSLPIGSITTGQEDVCSLDSGTVRCSPTTTLFLEGPDHSSERLIPVSTSTSSPSVFQTEHTSPLRILGPANYGGLISPQSPLSPPGCFQVHDPSGTSLEYGCTPDSVRTEISGGNTSYSQWDLDKIVAPHAGPGALSDYISYRYLQDVYTYTTGTGQQSTTTTSVRDAGVKQITYGAQAASGHPLLPGPHEPASLGSRLWHQRQLQPAAATAHHAALRRLAGPRHTGAPYAIA